MSLQNTDYDQEPIEQALRRGEGDAYWSSLWASREVCRKAGCGNSARPVVCPAKAGMFSRRKACWGKSQKPRSLDSRVAGNQYSEAYRQRLPREDDESPGRNDSERKSGLESA